MTTQKLLILATVLFALAIGLVLIRAEASPPRASLDVQIPVVPAIAIVDGRAQLVYEAHITNFGSNPVTLTRVDVLRESGAVVHSFDGAELESGLAGVGVRTPGTESCLVRLARDRQSACGANYSHDLVSHD